MWKPFLDKDIDTVDILFSLAIILLFLIIMGQAYSLSRGTTAPENQPDNGGEFEDVSSHIINSGLLHDI